MKRILYLIIITLTLPYCNAFPGLDTISGTDAKKKILNAANSIDRISLGIVTGSYVSTSLVNLINTILVPAIISINNVKYYDKESVEDCVNKINSITGLILGGATTLPLCDIKEASFIDIGPLNIIDGKNAKVNDALAFFLLFGGDLGSSSGGNTTTPTPVPTTPAACTTSGATDGTIQQLSFSVVDAEYDLTSNRIILVDSANKFHYYNPSTNADTSLSLNYTPLNVTVSPDGTKAAVGHASNATLVNLPGASIAREVATGITAKDIAMSNTFVYISNANTTFSNVKSVTFSDGSINNHTGSTVYSNYLAYNSTGNSLYLADTGVTPVDIRKISTAANPPTYQYDSIYHGDYSICGPIWLTKDASKTFNSCLTAFTVSATQGSDIQYSGTLSSTSLLRITHLNTDSSRIFLIASNVNSSFIDTSKDSSEYVHRYNLSNLSFISKKTLPCYTTGGQSYKTEGKFIFVNSSSTEYYVIAKPDSTSGNQNDQIIKFPY